MSRSREEFEHELSVWFEEVLQPIFEDHNPDLVTDTVEAFNKVVENLYLHELKNLYNEKCLYEGVKE